MSVFEEDSIRAILKAVLDSQQQKKNFMVEWDKAVKARVKSWSKEQSENSSPLSLEQLNWEAHIVEYVNFIYARTRVHGNAAKSAIPGSLDKRIPVLGPRFVPPSYLCLQKRHAAPNIKPSVTHLKPLNVVHPFYYPDINTCPQCRSTETCWDSWNGKGSHVVHGINQEETALGFQLRCKACHARGNGQYCTATTNAAFWESWEHWKVPRGIPHFFKRCAVTRELFEFIIELRPTETSGGLAKHIKQFHLLEHRKLFVEYLQAFKSRRQSPFEPLHLESFRSSDEHDSGYAYDDKSISEDMVSEVYLEYSNHTRKSESDDYIRTLTGTCVSLDHTFRCVSKATVANAKKGRTGPLKALLSVINEANEIIAWRFTQSQANAEIGEVLSGISTRCEKLGVPPPEMVVANNCCHVRKEILHYLPKATVVLDVYHFLMRYVACVVGGTRNPNRKQVSIDIADAILETRANGKEVAKYWPKEDQILRLKAAYEKWDRQGVWSVAAPKVHSDQLQHVQNGCLHREKQDLPCDGSRIEGSHKGWNSLQHAFASGIVMFTVLSHDFVLRRNIRIATAARVQEATPFVWSLFGSHHVRLASHTAHLWNSILERQPARNDLKPLPTLLAAESSETFGVVHSTDAATYGGWFEVKHEDEDTTIDLSHIDERILDNVVDDLGIDPVFYLQANNHVREMCGHRPDSESDTVDLTEEPKGSTGKRRAGSASSDSESNTVDLTGESKGSTGKRRAGSASSIDEPSSKKGRMMEVSTQQAEGSVNMSSHSTSAAPRSPSNRLQSVLDLPPLFRTFFFQRTPAVTEDANSHTTASVPPLLASLIQPLPLPDVPCGTKLTRSERFFSITTSMDVRSLSIARGKEFYLFMDLRAEQGWVTYKMTPPHYARATNDLNDRLKKGHPAAILKNPRVIIEKLAEVEAIVADRIVTNNYASRSSGSESFWRRHCAAVALGLNEVAGQLKRRPQVCGRCRTIMYPGPTGSSQNHRRGICGDGVQSTAKHDDDGLPEWPQPPGIFTSGTQFSPVEFLKTLNTVYLKYVVQEVPASDIPAEYDAFARMLLRRTICLPNQPPAFRLYDLEIPISTPKDLFVNINGRKHLVLDALRND